MYLDNAEYITYVKTLEFLGEIVVVIIRALYKEHLTTT